MLASAIAAGGLVGLAVSFRNLPNMGVLQNYSPTEASYIYDVNGNLLTRIHDGSLRETVELDQVSPHLKRAVLAIEDSHFYQHPGINPTSVARAFRANLRQGDIAQGASTLTMQLVKNLFLSPEQTYSRKLAESVMALRIEQIYSKDQIFKLYLNNVFWGHNTYGVETAAYTYFRKSASELNLAEAAMMAGLIRAPERYSPFVDYAATKRRQAVVLERMQQLGWISAQQKKQAFNKPLRVGKPIAWLDSELPYVTQAVKAELKGRFGAEAVREGGLRVQTTIDQGFQDMAKATVKQAHQNIVRQGVNAKQMALVAVDPRTHFVKVMVGGVDYDKSQYNRAVQARRQPGSSFKPFVYYTAFASGNYLPGSKIKDIPVRYGNYKPTNYGGGYMGTITLRTALVQSRNIPAVKLGQALGLENVIFNVRKLGVESPMAPVRSLPLGPEEVSPLEMANAYATFASNGWYEDATAIVRATNSDGRVLIDNQPQPKRVLNPWATATLTDVLKDVVAVGTGQAARIGRPAAGKTGTTRYSRDAWFVGYVPQLAAAVWVGNDDSTRMGTNISGGAVAAPAWRRFMIKALDDKPVQQFSDPNQFQRPAS
ncbi:MAG: penicillin-binding protein [Cyanobacteria bacterium QS_8_64_29]|nr:MAG: penicillin-binding protein [Cyanobacteria bacterium QS_8_64_29]